MLRGLNVQSRVKTGDEIHTLYGHTHWVTAVTLTQNGQHAISSSYQTIKVWDLENRREFNTLHGHDLNIWSVAATPDGKHIVSTSDDNSIRVWNIFSGKEVIRFYGESGIWACAVSQDGNTLFAGEMSGRVHFLRLKGI